MTGSLARFHARSPRYILNTDDSNLVRLSGAEHLSWEEKTELRDVSLTGLSFLAPQDLSPQIGEVIKIQFTVPGAEQMACYAIVIRIEKINSHENSVAVHFYKLDRTQRLNLVQGITEKISARKFNPNDAQITKWISISGLILTLLCWLTLMKIYFLK